MSFTNIFSHSVVCLLVLLIVSFAVQKFLFWWGPNSSFLLLFPLPWRHVKKLLRPRSNRFLPAFSSRILMASCLMFRSSIHFEFIFVYGVRKWSRFILLHVAVQFSQHHLLKRLSLFHWIFFPALSKISCPFVCGSISGFSILLHWSEGMFLYHTILMITAL